MTKVLFILALIAVVGWLAMRFMKVVPGMPRDEAAKLLGVDAAAGTNEVLDAHRRLIARVHPDAGGNAELAARINQARDTMLKP